MPANNGAQKALHAALALPLIFAAYAKAAHDAPEACIVFGLISAVAVVFLLRASTGIEPLRIPFSIPLTITLTAAVLSLSHSYYPPFTFLELWIVGFAALFYVILANAVRSKAAFDTFWRVASLSLWPVLAAALYQQFTGHPDHWGRWDIFGTLINSNLMAGFALPWVFISLGRTKRNAWDISTLCFSLLLLLLARSWWAWVCFLLGMTILARPQLNRIRCHRPILFYGALGLVIGGLLIKTGLKLADAIPPYYYGKGRLDYWATAIRMFVEHPFHGVGFGAFGFAYPFFKESSPAQNTLFAHSSLWGWVAETGLGGLIALGTWSWAVVRSKVYQGNRFVLAALFSSLTFGLLSIHQEYFLNKLILAALLAEATASLQADLFRWNGPRRLLAIAILLLLPSGWLRTVFNPFGVMNVSKPPTLFEPLPSHTLK